MGNKIRIGIFGSCATREVFTTYYNDYKQHFDLVFSHERESVISLFQSPLEFDENQLKILPDTKKNKFRSKNIINDFSKSFFNDLKKGIDFLIIDVYFEVLFGILILDNGSIITNNKWDLHKTEFSKHLSGFWSCEILQRSDKYFKLWKKYCDKFFHYLNENYPNVKIILNKIKLADHVIRNDYSIYINYEFNEMVKSYSPFIIMLEDYIEKNYDVISINYDDFPYTQENNRWNPYVVHLTPNYYKYIYYSVCNICGVDEKHLLCSKFEYLFSKSLIYENLLDNFIKQLDNLTNENNSLKLSIEEKNKIIISNNEELYDLHKFKNDVLSSSSWKFTKIFRDLKK